MSLFNQGMGVNCPGEILRDVDSQEFKTGYMLHLGSIDIDVGESAAFGLPEVYDQFFGLLDTEDEVVGGAP